MKTQISGFIENQVLRLQTSLGLGQLKYYLVYDAQTVMLTKRLNKNSNKQIT